MGTKVREEGPYNHTEKYTLAMAISGDIDGDRWLDFVRKGGTTVNDTQDFILQILQSIKPGTAQSANMEKLTFVV